MGKKQKLTKEQEEEIKKFEDKVLDALWGWVKTEEDKEEK